MPLPWHARCCAPSTQKLGWQRQRPARTRSQTPGHAELRRTRVPAQWRSTSSSASAKRRSGRAAGAPRLCRSALAGGAAGGEARAAPGRHAGQHQRLRGRARVRLVAVHLRRPRPGRDQGCPPTLQGTGLVGGACKTPLAQELQPGCCTAGVVARGSTPAPRDTFPSASSLNRPPPHAAAALAVM